MKRNTYIEMSYTDRHAYKTKSWYFTRYGFLLLLLATLFLQSCDKDEISLKNVEEEVQLTEDQQLEANAISELATLSQKVMLDEEVRRELVQIAVEPIYIDRYIGLRDLLEPTSIQQHKANGIAEAGAFKRLFEQSYDPSIHTSLRRYIAKATQVLSSRTDGNPDEDLYLYCPYCEYYGIDQVVSEGFTVAQAVLGGGQTGPGVKPLSDGSFTDVTVSDDYAMTTPTVIVTTEPQGIIIPPVGAEILICEVSEANQPFRCCYYTYEGEARYSDPYGCFYSGGNTGGGVLEPRIDEDWLECDGFSTVYAGHIQSTYLWDDLFSVTDGGGNEMRLARIGAGSPFTVDDGQIETNRFAAVLSKYITRGRIDDDYILTWGDELDPDWDCNDPAQMFVLYEEDENSDSEFSGSIGFTPEVELELGVLGEITLEPGIEAEIGFSITIEADDDVIMQQTYTREEYFSRNRTGRNSCGTHPILASETVFADYFDHDEYAKHTCYRGFVTLPDVYFE